MEKLTPNQARVLAGYKSMAEMALAMGLPVSTYTSKEQGRTAFTIKEAPLFSELCGRPFSDIDFLWCDRPATGTEKGESDGAE